MRRKTTLEVERSRERGRGRGREREGEGEGEGEGEEEGEGERAVHVVHAPVELTLLIILSSKGCRAVNSLSTST